MLYSIQRYSLNRNNFKVLINASYVIGFLPTTGLPIPFISYGGSQTIFTLASIGILMNISKIVNYHLSPLNDLNQSQISKLTGLSEKGIKRALDRQWSVPFLNPPEEIYEKVKLICESFNVHIFKGNRMSHLLSSESHKGEAVNKLKQHLQNNDVKIIALGDSQNDLPLLEYADISIVIPGHNGPNKYLKNGIDNGNFKLANAPHAKGWSNSVQDVINNIIDL